jgi:non-ribosomal peptide synthetase component F
LEELCRSEGATLQMGLLALVAVLLHRYSRQADVAIRVPSWGRIHPALEPLIGLFINTLPIRTRLEAEQSFRELLRQVRATALAAYEHQELPFEQMVAALTVERDTSRNPLVQVMLQLFEQPQEPPPSLVGVALETLDAPNDACRFDLEFFLRHGPDGGLEGQLVYALDLFAADRMERLSSHFLTLLSLVLQTPDAPVQGLSLLPESERRLIESWQQGPSVERPDCTSPVVCVHEMFEQQVARTPDALALIFGDERLSYSELNARANQLADQLIDCGVGRDGIVAVCLRRSPELIVSLLAILKAGGAYLPLDPDWPEQRRSLLLQEAGCHVLLQEAGLVVLDAPQVLSAESAAGTIAYLTYTSGSTGIPKGVLISHESILRLVDQSNGFLIGSGCRVLHLAPVAFDAATFEIWGPLLNGGTLVLAPPTTPTLS